METDVKLKQSNFGRWIALILLLLLVFHFLVALFYDFTETNNRPAWVRYYMDPLFTQNFKIFAPNVPTESVELYVSFKTKTGKWTNWENPGRNFFETSNRNRFSSSRYNFLLYKKYISDLQYVAASASYFAQKNRLKTNEIVNFKKEYFQASTAFKLAMMGLKDLSQGEYHQQSGNTFKCCVLVYSIPETLSKKASYTNFKTNYSFFYF